MRPVTMSRRPGGLNQFIAKDVLGLTLHYFTGDYSAIDESVTPFPGYSAYLNADYRPLYNGNISSMATNFGKFNKPLLYNYKYDQLNRLTRMDAYTGLN